MLVAHGEGGDFLRANKAFAGRLGADMTRSNAVQNGDGNDAALDPKALEAIGRALKAHYDDLVDAPLPDKFLELLTRLEEKERLSQTPGKRDAPE